MPESPEVRRITDKLRSRLKGKSLLWLELGPLDPTSKYQPIGQVWNQISPMFPSSCLEIICKAKQLFYFFENGLAFISGLGEEGHWYYFDLKNEMGQNKLTEYYQGKNYRRVCLAFGTASNRLYIQTTSVWYDDMISHGNFTITNWAGALEKMMKLGPDLLASTHPFKDIHPVIQRILPQDFNRPVTLEQFIQGVRAPRRGQMILCKFLMNQEYFGGIGNYLKSEILYRARISPFRTLSSLTDNEISALFSTALSTISQAYQAGGLTHGTFLDPDMEKGVFSVFIYKKAGELDPLGNVIQFMSKQESPDGRGTYYVPQLQV